MPQVIKGANTAPLKKDIGEHKDPKLPFVIGACVIAFILVVFFAYSSFIKSTTPAIRNDVVAPLPGYPNTFPYNNKNWQDGKIPMGGGIPAPPSMGGKPPVGGSSSTLPIIGGSAPQ